MWYSYRTKIAEPGRPTRRNVWGTHRAPVSVSFGVNRTPPNTDVFWHFFCAGFSFAPLVRNFYARILGTRQNAADCEVPMEQF